MCFNSGVSLATGAVIGVIGLLTIKKSKGVSEFFFAAIPLIFAVQQITEGFLWVVLKHNEYEKWRQPLTVLFIFFAQVAWPFWVPLSIFIMEGKPGRKNFLLILFLIGLCSSFFGAYRLIFHSVHAEIEERHIKYVFDFSGKILALTPILYILPTIVSPFVSSRSKMAWLGILILGSFLVAGYFFTAQLVSVWCFFAAVISGMIFWMVKQPGSSLRGQK